MKSEEIWPIKILLEYLQISWRNMANNNVIFFGTSYANIGKSEKIKLMKIW